MAIKNSKNKSNNFLSVIVLALIVLVFFWKVLIRDQVPMPGDLMVGSYFPWLEEKWGYVTGVPVKNPLVSDIFSTIYLWKQVVSESIKSGQWPLWNPYSYSGYPLLANLNSGALHPFNLLFVVFGQMNGWSAWMMLSIFGEMFGMYWFLRVLKKSEYVSIIGAVTFGFSGFSILWNQFAGANVAMMWWPVGLGLVEKFFETKNRKYLWWFPGIIFLIIASGHFQICVYSALLFVSYFVWKWSQNRVKVEPLFLVFLTGLTVTMSLLQLLPVAEMGGMSVRFDEGYIKSYNYGLLPIANFITLLAPDFFGNPTTYNYWGFFNYLESNFYIGVIGFLSLVWGIYNFKKLGNGRYFLILALTALALGFDTPLGKLIYLLKVPGISTSAAGRIASIFVFSGAVVTAFFVESLEKMKLKEVVRYFWGVAVSVGVIGIIVFVLKRGFTADGNVAAATNMMVGLRNLFFPGLFLFGFGVIFLIRKFNISKWALLFLVVGELFRFGWKWTPFTDKKMIFPKTEITDYIQITGSEYYRVEREKGELFPPNVWSAYRVMSPSGYDPMASKKYTELFEKRVNLNKQENPGVSRYLELNTYNAKSLGEYNVKYLWVLKRDKDNNIFGDQINKTIDLKNEWKVAKETKGTVLLENRLFKQRVSLIGENGVEDNKDVYIDEYTNNEIKIKYISKNDGQKLILRDAWYPGWKAYVNGKEVKIEKYEEVFRAVEVSTGAGEVRFVYFPNNFKIGLVLFIVGMFIWVAGFFKLKKPELR